MWTRVSTWSIVCPPSLDTFIADSCPVIVNAALHAAFDKKGWLLLPVDVDILDGLLNATASAPPKSVIHKVRYPLSIPSMRTSHPFARSIETKSPSGTSLSLFLQWKERLLSSIMEITLPSPRPPIPVCTFTLLTSCQSSNPTSTPTT